MPLYTPPPQVMTCIENASQTYHVPSSIVLAVMRQEGGRVGAVTTNKNGTYDIGPMQINSSHLSFFAKHGISRDMLLNDPCVNVYAGTWMIANGMAHSGDFWRGVGLYHSATPVLNVSYQHSVWARYLSLMHKGYPK